MADKRKTIPVAPELHERIKKLAKGNKYTIKAMLEVFVEHFEELEKNK